MTNEEHLAVISTLRAVHSRLRVWLFGQALPLWWELGIDRKDGGFFERISQDGAVVEAPRRIRVVGRQLFSFATALRLGWDGPAAEAVDHGLKFLLEKGQRADGVFLSQVTADGNEVLGHFNLYDQAFALFGLAAAAKVRPDRANELATVARTNLAAMRAGWSHPLGGFREDRPERADLLANPHMHVLEASIAWASSGIDADLSAWDAQADEIAALCMARFVNPETTVLKEYYNADWRPAAGVTGRIFEPGHHFEWSWLMGRWGRLRDRSDAVELANRLTIVAENHGVDPFRNAIFNEMLDDYSVLDPRSRLWHQTERIKAWLSLAESDPSLWPVAVEKITMASDGLMGYFTTKVRGIWFDILQPDGSYIVEDARASSLYHIVCAFEELDRIVGGFDRAEAISNPVSPIASITRRDAR